MNNRTEVHLKGALEPLVLNEPFEATMMNMSAAGNANQKFFLVHDVDGTPLCISISEVLFMRNRSEI